MVLGRIRSFLLVWGLLLVNNQENKFSAEDIGYSGDRRIVVGSFSFKKYHFRHWNSYFVHNNNNYYYLQHLAFCYLFNIMASLYVGQRIQSTYQISCRWVKKQLYVMNDI